MNHQDENEKTGIVLCQQDIEKWFGVLEYLLLKTTLLILAIIGVYHLLWH